MPKVVPRLHKITNLTQQDNYTLCNESNYTFGRDNLCIIIIVLTVIVQTPTLGGSNCSASLTTSACLCIPVIAEKYIDSIIIKQQIGSHELITDQ